MSRQTNAVGNAAIFGLEEPTKQSAIKNLSRILGKPEAEMLWNSTCYQTGVSPFTEKLEELEKVFRALSLKEGSVGVCGKSLVVIAMTFKNLNGRK